jgi:hypothetical protein
VSEELLTLLNGLLTAPTPEGRKSRSALAEKAQSVTLAQSFPEKLAALGSRAQKTRREGERLRAWANALQARSYDLCSTGAALIEQTRSLRA